MYVISVILCSEVVGTTHGSGQIPSHHHAHLPTAHSYNSPEPSPSLPFLLVPGTEACVTHCLNFKDQCLSRIVKYLMLHTLWFMISCKSSSCIQIYNTEWLKVYTHSSGSAVCVGVSSRQDSDNDNPVLLISDGGQPLLGSRRLSDRKGCFVVWE